MLNTGGAFDGKRLASYMFSFCNENSPEFWKLGTLIYIAETPLRCAEVKFVAHSRYVLSYRTSYFTSSFVGLFFLLLSYSLSSWWICGFKVMWSVVPHIRIVLSEGSLRHITCLFKCPSEAEILVIKGFSI